MHTFEGKNFHFDLGVRTYVMGILNVTPDSFSDGGKYADPDAAVQHALQMQAMGADIVDIGAESTRPGHTPVPYTEEIERLKPVLQRLCGKLTVPVSVDTLHPETADWALGAGAAIVNDVTGVFSAEMAQVVKKHDAGWIVCHGGDADAVDTGAPLEDVRVFFADMTRKCIAAGLKKEQLCMDPGIGFGKSRTGDYAVLRDLRLLKTDCALLVGASRKRLIGEASPSAPAERMAGTVACHTAAVAGGADILRVHDVFEGVQAARVADALYRKNAKKQMGKILLSDLRVFAYHGVNVEEKQFGQSFFADVEMTVDFAAAVQGDDIESTVSYAQVAKTLQKALTQESFDLIEKAADAAATAVLCAYPAVEKVRLRLKKPDAPMKAECAYAAVEVEKERST